MNGWLASITARAAETSEDTRKARVEGGAEGGNQPILLQ
jgi:hypothetical protein